MFGQGALTPANGWADQADVLIRTRMAADALGATRLHRPEWVAVNERTDDVYVTLTNGSGNSAAVNSGRDPNPFGHILRFREEAGDLVGGEVALVVDHERHVLALLTKMDLIEMLASRGRRG